MPDVPVTSVSKENNFYWIKLGGSMRKISLEEIYKIISKYPERRFSVSIGVKKDLENYVLKNKLDEKILEKF